MFYVNNNKYCRMDEETFELWNDIRNKPNNVFFITKRL